MFSGHHQFYNSTSLSCRSCKTVVEASESVSVNAAAVQQFAQQLDAAAVQAAGAKASTVFPIKFDSLEAEVGACPKEME
jgi:hypothetical protein